MKFFRSKSINQLVFCFIGSWMLVSEALAASQSPALIQKFVTARNNCYDLAVGGWDSGVTTRMVEASVLYGECLVKVIKNAADHAYPTSALGEAGLIESLRTANNARIDLYDRLHNACHDCAGTDNQLLASSAEYDQLEDALRVILSKLNDGIDPVQDHKNRHWMVG